MSGDTKFTRRDILQAVVMLTPATMACCATVQAAEMPVVRAEDPVARAVLYFPNSSDVPAEHPLAATHDTAQNCANCVHVRGTTGENPRRCPLFAGRLINAEGWCSVWAKA